MLVEWRGWEEFKIQIAELTFLFLIESAHFLIGRKEVCLCFFYGVAFTDKAVRCTFVCDVGSEAIGIVSFDKYFCFHNCLCLQLHHLPPNYKRGDALGASPRGYVLGRR